MATGLTRLRAGSIPKEWPTDWPSRWKGVLTPKKEAYSPVTLGHTTHVYRPLQNHNAHLQTTGFDKPCKKDSQLCGSQTF